MPGTKAENEERDEACRAPARTGLRATLSACIRRYIERRRYARALAALTREQLAEIGLTPSQAAGEQQKSWFWN